MACSTDYFFLSGSSSEYRYVHTRRNSQECKYERDIAVVNNMKSAYDLLDKRGEIYSSRPRNIMG